jgi:hypothetical protein
MQTSETIIVLLHSSVSPRLYSDTHVTEEQRICFLSCLQGSSLSHTRASSELASDKVYFYLFLQMDFKARMAQLRRIYNLYFLSPCSLF